jgi:hypothetical protein
MCVWVYTASLVRLWVNVMRIRYMYCCRKSRNDWITDSWSRVCNFAKCPLTHSLTHTRTHARTRTHTNTHTHKHTPFIQILENNRQLGVLHEVRKDGKRTGYWTSVLLTLPQSQHLTADITQRDLTWISSETVGYLTSRPARPENRSRLRCETGMQSKWQAGKTGSTIHASHFHSFQKVRTDWSYDWAPNKANVFETNITQPGRAEVSLAATTLCRLQLTTVLGSRDVKLYGH